MPEQESAEIDGGWTDLARARDGDAEAWRVLFERHSPPLLRMAALITGSADIARDCVQESFVRILDADIRHHGGSLRTYLSTIVYRLALKEKARRDRQTTFPEWASPDPSPLEEALADERLREVAGVLRQLPAVQRDVLVLRLHGDLSYEEIADMTGVSVGTVKSRIFYAVKAARKGLKKRGVI